MKYLITAVMLVGLLAGCAAGPDIRTSRVQTGAERLVEDGFSVLHGKNVGIITNHTAVVGEDHVADLMHADKNVKVVALFGPEHGIRGDDVGRIDDAIDERTGLPAYSLYGEIRKPTAEMLEGIDVLVFDIQDIGPRFYTYISTMGMAMEAAAEHGISFVVLDRPNPIGGELAEGFMRERGYESFVAYFPIPVTHGLTVGEIAIMAKEEGMLEGVENLDLHVVEMRNWRRNMLWPETDLEWIRPSPNMPDFETALIYPGACFFEDTNASEGRGTHEPFILVGAPWIDSAALAENLNERELPGLRFEPVTYVPESLPGMSPRPKFLGEEVHGVRHVITDPHAVRPVEAGMHVLHAFYHQTPEGQDFWRGARRGRLAASDDLHEMLAAGATAEQIIASWQDEVAEYDRVRRQYFIYQ